METPKNVLPLLSLLLTHHPLAALESIALPQARLQPLTTPSVDEWRPCQHKSSLEKLVTGTRASEPEEKVVKSPNLCVGGSGGLEISRR